MPYTTLVWGEEQAANGLTGTAAVGPTGTDFATSGDKIVFPTKGNYHIAGYGQTGDTKPQGCNLLPDNSNGNKGYYGPGGQIFHLNWLNLQQINGAVAIQDSDSVTGQCSSTNVNEGSVIGAHVFPGSVPGYPTRKSGRTHYMELCTVTSAAAVTYNSGAATVYAACTNTTNWYDPKANYVLNGIFQRVTPSEN
jgi:hypothetical protein